MAKEAILKIKAAEEEALAIRARAAEEAKERVRRAEATGKALCEKTEAELRRVNADKLALTRTRAEELLEVSRKKADEEAELLLTASEHRMSEAVKMIVEGVMEQCR